MPEISKRALTALGGSIKKWDGIVAGTVIDHGCDNCPLCQLYLANDCKACPVSIDTGNDSCIGTPYGRFIERAKKVDPFQYIADTPEAKRAATTMRNYLVRLRDKLTR
jgi:hypothetical protein